MSQIPVVQRFAAASLGFVNGQAQSSQTSPNRNRIVKATNLLVQQGFSPQPSQKATTNRLSKEFLFHIGATVVDEGPNFRLHETDAEVLQNKRIEDSSIYLQLERVTAPPNGFVLAAGTQTAQNPIFEIEDGLPPVDLVSLNFMLQGQLKHPGQDLIKIANSLSKQSMEKTNTLKYFTESWKYGQRGNF